MIEAPHRRKSI